MLNVVRRSFLLPLTALVAITLALVSPRGDFPLNDDWMYAWMVKTLLHEHRFVQHVYNSPYAIFQTFWGAAFCAVFGCSLTVLRVSTIVLSVAAIWFVAKSARELGASRGVSIVCGVLVFANPLFLNLTYSFMTEVPYLALMLASGYFYLRALRSGRSMDVLLGTLFAVMSFCNRQYGVLATAAFLCAIPFHHRKQLGPLKLASVAALFGPWIAMAAVFFALGTGSGSPFHTIGITGTVSVGREIGIILNVFFSLPLYIGLFLLPIACLSIGRIRWTRRRWVVFGVIAGFYSLLMVVGVQPLPRLPNLLRDFGVGPLTMYDAYFAHRGWSPTQLPPGVWRAITIAASVSFAALVIRWFELFRDGRSKYSRSNARRVRSSQYTFLLLWGLLLLFSPLNPGLNIYFDRYLQPGCIPLLLLAASRIHLLRGVAVRAAVLASLAAMYLFSLASLQDYLAWNRARWEAISIAKTKYGATNEQIDGGYEFNGTYTSDAFRAQHPDKPIDYSGERPWWVVDEVYAISFLPRDGYDAIETVPYSSWLSPRDAHLLILKRSP